MREIGILSDTHSHLPQQVFRHFAAVDEIWHAGDIGNLETLYSLQQFKPLRAVYGNIDGAEIRREVPEYLFFRIEDVSILMLHIGGYPPRYNKNSLSLIEVCKPDVFICGHSHILKIAPDPNRNLLHINPGACGKQGWQKVNTLLHVQVDGKQLKNLRIIEFPRNSP